MIPLLPKAAKGGNLIVSRYIQIHPVRSSFIHIYFEFIEIMHLSFILADKKFLVWNILLKRSRLGEQFTTNSKRSIQLMPVLNSTTFFHFWNKIVAIQKITFHSWRMSQTFYKVCIEFTKNLIMHIWVWCVFIVPHR